MMSAPASLAVAAASGVRMPPPIISGMSTASLIDLIISGGTGASAPEPASKYTMLIPYIWHARAYATARSLSCLPTGLALPTSPTFMPGSTIT